MPYVAAFAMAVESCSRFVRALSRQSKDVDMTSTIICRMAVADSRSDPPLTALSNWCKSYSSTVRKSDPSVVQRIRLVIWDLTIDVIAAAVASFTPIAASLAVFCLSALSCESAFVVISGATMLLVYLSACASAIECLLTSLFLMATLDL